MKREIFLVTHLSPSPSHFLIPFPSFIHSLTHSAGLRPSIPFSFNLSLLLRAQYSLLFYFFLLLWRWRGCEKNSWKHNEISLPFAISFGFHMVEIVSRICVCLWNKCRRGWASWWPKEYEYESECVYVCIHVGWRGWRMCEHVAAAITVLETISSSFWSGSYLSNSNGGSSNDDDDSNYIHFTTRHCFVSLCVSLCVCECSEWF